MIDIVDVPYEFRSNFTLCGCKKGHLFPISPAHPDPGGIISAGLYECDHCHGVFTPIPNRLGIHMAPVGWSNGYGYIYNVTGMAAVPTEGLAGEINPWRVNLILDEVDELPVEPDLTYATVGDHTTYIIGVDPV